MTDRQSRGPVQRWVEESGSLEPELAAAFRELQSETPLPSSALAAVRRRLRHSQPPRRVAWWRVAPALAFLLCVSSVAAHFGGVTPHLLLRLFEAPISTTKPKPKPQSKPRPTTAATDQTVQPSRAREPEPSPEPEAATEPERRAPAVAPSTPSGSTPSQLGQESAALEPALIALRQKHDAKQALALLDQYRARFPRGALALEATTARLDALLLAGKRREALAVLDALPLERVGRRVELRLLRGELRAEQSCKRALVDFELVLQSGATPWAERALYGRAVCLLRSGDRAGARADLERYLQRYPGGRFAGDVRAHLQAEP